MTVHVWEAQSKAEARKAYAEADKQNEIVKQAYRDYHKTAMIVAKLHEDNDFQTPVKTSSAYKDWLTAVKGKRDAYRVWQKEAQIHGAMFVPLMDKPVSETDSKEPW